MNAYAPVRPRQPREVLTVTVVLALALVAWILVVNRMEGMDAGPGTDLGGFGWYMGIWVTMMAAMMLPSAAPMVLIFARVQRDRAEKPGRQVVGTAWFLAGYLIAWALYGAAAYGLYRAAVSLDWGLLSWHRAGRYLAAGTVAAAGIYQLTPLKNVCLRHCRSPLHFVLHGWREGRTGAVRMGIVHGAYCVGCCWGLMLVLWGVGVMSLIWMAAVAALILAEKATAFGHHLTKPMAVGFVALGIWIAAAPGSVPALTEPGSAKAERAMERMTGPGMNMHHGGGSRMQMHHGGGSGMKMRPRSGSDMKMKGGPSGSSMSP
jgi:predicted metal-binding membrane protein